jgi:plasmid stabilization system protein ParE
MRVRWTTDAADDLERICDYIADSNLAGEFRLRQRLGRPRVPI